MLSALLFCSPEESCPILAAGGTPQGGISEQPVGGFFYQLVSESASPEKGGPTQVNDRV